MALEEDDGGVGGIPEWVVTFGDMMSLLLTFFIMLVSMSEIKEEERFQALVESMRKRFGHDASMVSFIPGHSKPRNSTLNKLATMGRARRANTMRGGDKVKAPVGDNPKVRTIRPADHATAGGVIYFEEGVAALTDENKRQLQTAAQQIGGKPQKVEIRGHTSRRPVPEGSPFRDNWDLAYTRCRNTLEFLVKIGIEPARIRLGVAAENEPVHVGIDPRERKKNARVEVLMLNERVEDLDASARRKLDPSLPTEP